eukprot:1145672-Pelagomonas_calceolata.AAC.2
MFSRGISKPLKQVFRTDLQLEHFQTAQASGPHNILTAQMERNRTRQLLRNVNNMYASQRGTLKPMNSKASSVVG